jgi:hypothetical protein
MRERRDRIGHQDGRSPSRREAIYTPPFTISRLNVGSSRQWTTARWSVNGAVHVAEALAERPGPRTQASETLVQDDRRSQSIGRRQFKIAPFDHRMCIVLKKSRRTLRSITEALRRSRKGEHRIERTTVPNRTRQPPSLMRAVRNLILDSLRCGARERVVGVRTMRKQFAAAILLALSVAPSARAAPNFAERLEQADRLAWLTNWYRRRESVSAANRQVTRILRFEYVFAALRQDIQSSLRLDDRQLILENVDCHA